METLSLLFACATIILAIFYIRKLKKQINNLEKAFKELSMLYYEERRIKLVNNPFCEKCLRKSQ